MSFSWSFIGATVGESCGAGEGLEHLVIESATLLETELLFVSISNLAAAGVTVFLLFSRIDSRFASWKG